MARLRIECGRRKRAEVGYTHVNATDPPHAFVYHSMRMSDLGTGYGAAGRSGHCSKVV